jgi:hypothetical protein
MDSELRGFSSSRALVEQSRAEQCNSIHQSSSILDSPARAAGQRAQHQTRPDQTCTTAPTSSQAASSFSCTGPTKNYGETGKREKLEPQTGRQTGAGMTWMTNTRKGTHALEAGQGCLLALHSP